MNVPENCAGHINPRARPFGYLYVHLLKEEKRQSSFSGEIELRYQNRSCSFRFLIVELDLGDKTYQLSIFKDRMFRSSVIDATVKFLDQDPNHLDIDVIAHGRNWNDETVKRLIGIFHTLIHLYLIQSHPPANMEGGQAKFDKTWVRPFNDETVMETLRDMTGETLGDFISRLNLLL